MPNSASVLVAQALCEQEYDGVSSLPWLLPYVMAAEVNDIIDTYVENMARDAFDTDIFPLIATKAIRQTLDLRYITEVFNDRVYKHNISVLFGE